MTLLKFKHAKDEPELVLVLQPAHEVECALTGSQVEREQSAEPEVRVRQPPQ